MNFFYNDVCLVCNNVGEKEALLNLKGKDYDIDYFKCLNCETIIPYPKTPISHAEYTEKEIVDYIELNGNIEILAGYIERLYPESGHKTFLDVGCGYGFLIDYLHTLYNWEVVGIEPSEFAKYGAETLQVPIIHAELTKNKSIEKYDIVFSAEVIEHVKDPNTFIENLKSYLSDSGILMVTTPDARLVFKDQSKERVVEILSPKYHEFVTTPDTLEMLVDGFAYTEYLCLGNSTILCASTRPFDLNKGKIDLDHKLNTYYTEKLRAFGMSKSGPAYNGVLYRYFRALIDQGKFKEALDLYVYEQFDFSSTCGGPLAYYASKINEHIGNHELASQHRFLAYNLCKQKIEDSPEFSSVERDLLPLMVKQ